MIIKDLTMPDFNQLLFLGDNRYFEQPEPLQHLEKTPFCKNGLNLIYGPSKSGKSTSIYKILVDAGYSKNVIVLDKDHNKETHIMSLLKKLNWKNKHLDELEYKLLESNLTNIIIVFDSLKDFTNGKNLDDNSEAQNVMMHIRQYVGKGATAIVIAHSTKDANGIDKIKGNEETIKSKSDIIYRFNNSSKGRIFILEASRFTNAIKYYKIETKEIINYA